MLIGTVVLLVMAVVAAFAIVLPAVKIIQKLFFTGKKDKPAQESPHTEKTKKDCPPQEEQQTEESKELDFPSEDVRERYGLSGRRGITEDVVSGEEFAFDANPKEISQDLATCSGLTLVESEYRRNATPLFRGFNIAVEDGVKVTLTYAGQAIAQIRREVNDVSTVYRIFTFPPKIDGNILPADVAVMLDASASVRNVSFDPNLAYYAMRELFCGPANLESLRADIDPQIQERESSFRAKDLLEERSTAGESRKIR